jgi:hypothetical protein
MATEIRAADVSNTLRLFTSPSPFPNPRRLRLFMHETGIADHFDEQGL